MITYSLSVQVNTTESVKGITRNASSKRPEGFVENHVPLACGFIVFLPEVRGEQPLPSGQANSGWLQLQPCVWQSQLQVLSILSSWLSCSLASIFYCRQPHFLVWAQPYEHDRSSLPISSQTFTSIPFSPLRMIRQAFGTAPTPHLGIPFFKDGCSSPIIGPSVSIS